MNQTLRSMPSVSEPSSGNDEFFIGYAPPMPAGIARFVRRALTVIGSGVFVWALALGPVHVPLEGGTFEFGHPRTFSGTIVEFPVSALRPDGDTNGTTPWPLLVAPGKHGAAEAVRGLAGHHVSLTGTRIARGAETMIEIAPASIRAAHVSGPIDVSEPGTALVSLRGEIVDAKCFLGVMVPGAGKTHKDCAGLCLRGGIPPALFVKDRAGASRLLLVTGPAGEPLAEEALRVAGEAIDLTGTIASLGGWLVVKTDPATWRPVVK
jgi:hypothetical protein